MSIEQVSAPAPDSLEAKALAELEKEGHVIGTEKPDANDGEIKDTPAPSKEEPKVEEKPKEEPAKTEVPPKEDAKPERSPKMVETWKLKVAEDQKLAAIKKVEELEAKLKEISGQKSPVTQTQSDDIASSIKELAKDKEVDVEFLTNFANTILTKAGSKNAVPSELTETIKKIQEERQLEKELNEFSSEFDKDVAPLLVDKNLSGEALSQIKNSLKDYAFSDTYAKVPLKEIFLVKQSELNIPIPKKSSEGKSSVKIRANDVVDIDNLSEEEFSKLPAEKVEEYLAKRSTGTWRKPR